MKKVIYEVTLFEVGDKVKSLITNEYFTEGQVYEVTAVRRRDHISQWLGFKIDHEDQRIRDGKKTNFGSLNFEFVSSN